MVYARPTGRGRLLLTRDILGNARVDDLATPNTGAGPRRYDDRGVYEFQL
jgi:hypothetical protein